MPVIDLNTQTNRLHSVVSDKRSQQGNSYVHRQTCLLASSRLSSFVHVSPMRRALPRRSQNKEFHLPRPVSRHGFCAVDLPRELARHRSLPTRTRPKALSHGHPQPDFTKHSLQCQQSPGLENLRRSGPQPHSGGTQALLERLIWRRTRPNRIRPGCDNRRPMFISLSLGAFSQSQGGDQAPYPARFARQYPNLYPYLRRQEARSQRLGRADSRGRSLLRYGSWLSRLSSSPSPKQRLGILCHPRQEKHGLQTTLLSPGGPRNRHDLRPDHTFNRPAFVRALPRQASPHQNARCRVRQSADLSHEQFHPASHNHFTALSFPLANRTLLQMDQTEFAHKNFLRHQQERRKNPNMDRCHRLFDDCNSEETAKNRRQSLHNSTDFERYCIRKNAIETATYEP